MRKQHTPLQLPHTDILPEIVEPLLTWYRGQSTLRCLPWREEVTPYHTWISEIMLQQTRASAVIPYYTRFLEVLPDIASLARCDDELLMKLWQGLGYYSRARNLKKAACQIVEDFGGQMPADFAALLALPGIGRYTASAIGSIAFGLPLPAVDGNILRVTMRVLQCGEDIAQLSAVPSRMRSPRIIRAERMPAPSIRPSWTSARPSACRTGLRTAPTALSAASASHTRQARRSSCPSRSRNRSDASSKRPCSSCARAER